MKECATEKRLLEHGAKIKMKPEERAEYLKPFTLLLPIKRRNDEFEEKKEKKMW